MRQTRHRSPVMLEVYAREHAPLMGNAVTRLGLRPPMTATTTPMTAQALSARTRQTYTQDRALFADWCAATGAQILPADPDTVVAFLTGCPAEIGTLRVRVAAIDHHHAIAGFPGPLPAGALPTRRGAVPAARPVDRRRRVFAPNRKQDRQGGAEHGGHGHRQ